MKKNIFISTILFLFNFCFTNHNDDNYDFLPYFSPGIQIGYGDSFFFSFQITAGILPEEFPIFPGGTVGKRIYRKNESWDIYNYYDLQFSIMSLGGIGFGKFYNNQYSYQKYKVWVGFFGLISYDYIHLNNKQHLSLAKSVVKYNPKTGELLSPVPAHNFGLFGVMPIFDINQM